MPDDAKTVKLTIDGRELEVPAGMRLFDACTEARDGEQLPHFCYHPDLSIAGVCRLCQVEVEGMPKLTIACNTMVRDGMVVSTRSEKVRLAAKQILEMHLINHPVDCPICDQAGECGLQDQYMNYGLYESEVAKTDKVHKAKAEVIGPHVILDQERCVLCSRCVRFCDEVTKTGELGIFNRGDRAELGVYPGGSLDNNYSLNTVDICPVGALTSRDFRFQKRVWLLRSASSVCPGCSTGCNVRVDHEGGRVFRLKPRRNDAVNGPWMCDKGRMTYRDLHADNRLERPLLRRDGELVAVDWPGFWDGLRPRLEVGGAALADPGQTLEELTLFKAAAARFCEGRAWGGPAEAHRGEADDLLLTADRAPNRTGLAWLGLDDSPAAALAAKLAETRGPVLVYGGDPAGADPALAAALADRDVIYLGTHRNATAELAVAVAPLAAWAEKEGVYANKDGRLQFFRRAIAAPGEAREDWRFLADLLAALGDEDPPADMPSVRRRVVDSLPQLAEIDLNVLPAAGAVPPAVGAAPGGTP